ncbi:MAG: hypothetical protein IJJ31_02250 [Mogibacterium sp.]|nr:hypothetical protein [Mogibacterium sp.]
MLDNRKKLRDREVTLSLNIYDFAWIAAIAAVSAVCLELFYRMIVNYNGKYESDIGYYALERTQSTEPQERLVGILCQWLFDINQSTLEINIMLALVIAAIIVANFAVIRFFLREDGLLESVPRRAVQVFSVAMLFIGPIYVPVIHEYFYRKSFSSFCWHSPTQHFMTLFAMIAAVCFLRMYMPYDTEGVSVKWWIATLITTFLATTSKPSYTIGLVFTIVIMFIAELIRKGADGFLVRFRRMFIMGMSVVPSGLYIIWLNKRQFADNTQFGEEHEIVFGLGPLLNYERPWAALLFGITFAIAVFAFNLKKFRDTKYKFALYTFVIGTLQWATISETGTRSNFGNFSWGRMFGCYFITLTACAVFLEMYYNRDFFSSRSKRTAAMAVIGLILAASVICQLYHFYLILTGHGYMR